MMTAQPLEQVPHAFDELDLVRGVLWNRRAVVCLDFDGTLAPIVDDPVAARPAAGASGAVSRLAGHCPVVVISGRDLVDVRERLGVAQLWYAGSHGLEIAGPDGEHHVHEQAVDVAPSLDAIESALAGRLDGIDGVGLERKRFSVSVHHRAVAEDDVDAVTSAVDEVVAEHTDLRVVEGRELREIRPALEWGKGAAVTWILERVGLGDDAFPVYAGDDVTDEDALEVVRGAGLGIVVRNRERLDTPTAAHLAVDDPDQLCDLLDMISELFDEWAELPT